MSETLTPETSHGGSTTIPIAVAGSPYQFKISDPYSSHSLILSLLPQRGNGRVLDVGAAHGYLAAMLRQRGFCVTGIESDPVLAAEAAKRCDEIYVADLDGRLPGFDRQFDVILYGDVLEHLKDPMTVLKTLSQSLRPEGIVIVSLPNIANIYVRLNLLMGRFDYADRGILDRTHLHFFTRKSFRSFLDEAGLEVLRLTATPIPLPLVVPERFHGRLLAITHSANAWMARCWMTMFGYQFVAVARMRSSL
jgi:2-polyprenyl-3-methyl-5-hydroxy-6-metoxy-1,4-benzoquinol methylase